MMCSFEERGNQIIDKLKRMGISHNLKITSTDRITWVEHLFICLTFPRISLEMNVVTYKPVLGIKF